MHRKQAGLILNILKVYVASFSNGTGTGTSFLQDLLLSVNNC